jgi:C-terminal processing protease CtpA/Prc
VDLPLGMVIGESETHKNRIEVLEVLEDGNAARTGIKVGDILRGTTAQKIDSLGASEKNIIFNATAGASTAGMKPKKALFLTDKRTYAQTTEAISSNSKDKGGSGRVGMIFERRYDD